MSKVKVFAAVVIFMFLIAGCGFKGPYFRSGDRASFVPAEIETTEEAIKKAEMSAGAKYCPEKIARAKELAKKGEELYWACRTEEAMKTLGRFLESSERHVSFLAKKAGHIEEYLQQR